MSRVYRTSYLYCRHRSGDQFMEVQCDAHILFLLLEREKTEIVIIKKKTMPVGRLQNICRRSSESEGNSSSYC